MLMMIIGLFGGLGLFIYGMQIASEGLQLAAGNRLKYFLQVLTKKQIVGVVVGIIITILIQSSSATTVILVGLVSAGLMNLVQTVGITLGSNIGTTFTVQLIAFKFSDYALILVGAAVIMIICSGKNKQLKYSGQILLGFGLVFYGMKVMSESVAPLRSNEYFRDLLIYVGKSPVLGVLVSAAFTGIIQSSAATIGLVLVLASQNLVTANMAIPLVLGANIGTCATALLSCIGATREAKRVAVMHILMKIIGVAVLLPFLPIFDRWVMSSSNELTRQIANAHTMFNFGLCFLFLPFSTQMANLVTWMFPDRKSEKKLGEATYLDRSMLQVPEMAVSQVHRQVVEMGRIVISEMLDRFMSLVRTKSEAEYELLDQAEEATDSLYISITEYVTSIGTNNLSDDLMQRNVKALYVANDLEHVGDILTNVVKLTAKLKSENITFSEEGFNEIQEITTQVTENFKSALQAYENSDTALATQVIKKHPVILRFEKELRFSHFDRMQCGNQKTFTSSSVHLDLIESLLRIDSHAVNIAQVVLGIV